MGNAIIKTQINAIIIKPSSKAIFIIPQISCDKSEKTIIAATIAIIQEITFFII